ncbi:hypothetical protein BKA65DRAFT_302583 [Rhexocercosporidium sp. MPI-PUGE-AT-0058]|nr:hypothetical protein BKA65DRAFT_302583 [Rhexocercosporidium sp. MPI-PUGE-AT-0058]
MVLPQQFIVSYRYGASTTFTNICSWQGRNYYLTQVPKTHFTFKILKSGSRPYLAIANTDLGIFGVGCWLLVVFGRWSLVVGHWSLVVGRCLLVVI